MSGAFREAIEVIPSQLPPAASPAELLSQGVAPAPVDAEQARAIDEVFSHQPAPESASAGVLGFLSAGMLLGQIVHDTLAPPADEIDKDDDKSRTPKPVK